MALTGAPLARRAAQIVPAYVVGLVLVFVGERILGSLDTWRWVATGLGLALAVVAAGLLLRAPDLGVVASADRERVAIHRALGAFAALGLVAVAVYFATTEGAMKALGVALWSPDARAKYRGALTAGWVVALVVALLPLVLGERALAPMRSARFLESRRVRAATLSGLTLAFAAAYAALFVYASSHYEGKLDYSFFRAARPSESTKNVAKNLPESVRVIAFYPPQNEIGAEVRGYLSELAREAPKLEVEVYDRLLEPGLAKDAKVTQDGMLVLYRGTQREALTVGADPKTARAKLRSLDVDFQKALLKVMRPGRTAYLTVGHGELNEGSVTSSAEGRTAKSLRKLLESQNYVVKELGLAQGLGTDVPKDAFLVAMLGPSKAVQPEEVAALDRYFQGGGKLLLALDPDGKVDLEPVAKLAGLDWHKTVLASDKVFAKRRYNDADRVNLVTNRFSSHASVTTLSRNSQRASLFVIGGGSLDKAAGAEGIKVDFAVKSLGDAFADANGNFAFDEGEKRASYNLGAAVTRGEKDAEARAFVVADVDCFSDAAFTNDANVVFALDVLRWLGGDESFAGAISSPEDVTIEHTKQKDLVWFYGVIFVAPLLVLGAGLVVTRRGTPRRTEAPGRQAPASLPRPERRREGDGEERPAERRKPAKKSARRKP